MFTKPTDTNKAAIFSVLVLLVGHQGWKQELGMSPQKDTQQKPQAGPRAESQADPQSAPTEPNLSVPSTGVVWVRISPNEVMHTVVVALLSAAVVLGAFF